MSCMASLRELMLIGTEYEQVVHNPPPQDMDGLDDLLLATDLIIQKFAEIHKDDFEDEETTEEWKSLPNDAINCNLNLKIAKDGYFQGEVTFNEIRETWEELQACFFVMGFNPKTEWIARFYDKLPLKIFCSFRRLSKFEGNCDEAGSSDCDFCQAHWNPRPARWEDVFQTSEDGEKITR